MAKLRIIFGMESLRRGLFPRQWSAVGAESNTALNKKRAAFRLLFPTGQNRSLKSLLAQAKYFLTAISAALGINEAYRFSALLRKEPSFCARWHEISFKGKLPFVDAKIVHIFGFHKILAPHSNEKFLFTPIYLIGQYIQLLIHQVSG